jgi:hypothetical protein
VVRTLRIAARNVGSSALTEGSHLSAASTTLLPNIIKNAT